jgi:hypothetical protein
VDGKVFMATSMHVRVEKIDAECLILVRAQFCFPQGVQLAGSRRAPRRFSYSLSLVRRITKFRKKKNRKKQHVDGFNPFFFFLHTEVDGGKFYGAALTYHRAIVRTDVQLCKI